MTDPIVIAKCELCGEPMPPGETMFKFHGYSGPCPKPPLPVPPKPGEWQPIATAPKDGTPVLAWYPKAFRGKGGHYIALWQDGDWYAAIHAFKFEPTHWMPLPAPPESR